MTTEAIPNYMFMDHKTDQVFDPRLSKYFTYDDGDKKEHHRFHTKISLPSSMQRHQQEHTSIHNIVYSSINGCLFINDKKSGCIRIQQLNDLENGVLEGKFNDQKNPIESPINKSGSLFLSKQENKLLIINPDEINIFAIGQDIKKILTVSNTTNKVTNACWNIEGTCVYCWHFEGHLYQLQIQEGTQTQFQQKFDVKRCTGIHRNGNRVFVLEDMTLYIIEGDKLTNTIKLNELINDDSPFYEFCTLIGIQKINNCDSEDYQSSDIYALVGVYYTAYEEGDEEPCNRYVYFLKGDLSKDSDSLKVRGNQIVLCYDNNDKYYYKGSLEENNLQKIGFSCIMENCGNFTVVLVQKTPYVFLLDGTQQFSKVNIFNFWPRHNYELNEESTGTTDKFMKGMTLMKNMFEFQKNFKSDQKNSDKHQAIDLICSQYGGQFMRLYFQHKETQCIIQFPPSVLVYSDTGLYRKYAACTIGYFQNEEYDEIKEYLSQKKSSQYIQQPKQRKNIFASQSKRQEKVSNSGFGQGVGPFISKPNNQNNLFKPSEINSQKRPDGFMFGQKTDSEKKPDGFMFGQKTDSSPFFPKTDGEKKPESFIFGQKTDSEKKPDSSPFFPKTDGEKKPESSLFDSKAENQKKLDGFMSGQKTDSEKKPDSSPFFPKTDGEKKPEGFIFGHKTDSEKKPDSSPFFPKTDGEKKPESSLFDPKTDTQKKHDKEPILSKQEEKKTENPMISSPNMFSNFPPSDQSKGGAFGSFSIPKTTFTAQENLPNNIITSNEANNKGSDLSMKQGVLQNKQSPFGTQFSFGIKKEQTSNETRDKGSDPFMKQPVSQSKPSIFSISQPQQKQAGLGFMNINKQPYKNDGAFMNEDNEQTRQYKITNPQAYLNFIKQEKSTLIPLLDRFYQNTMASFDVNKAMLDNIIENGRKINLNLDQNYFIRFKKIIVEMQKYYEIKQNRVIKRNTTKVTKAEFIEKYNKLYIQTNSARVLMEYFGKKPQKKGIAALINKSKSQKQQKPQDNHGSLMIKNQKTRIQAIQARIPKIQENQKQIQEKQIQDSSQIYPTEHMKSFDDQKISMLRKSNCYRFDQNESSEDSEEQMKVQAVIDGNRAKKLLTNYEKNAQENNYMNKKDQNQKVAGAKAMLVQRLRSLKVAVTEINLNNLQPITLVEPLDKSQPALKSKLSNKVSAKQKQKQKPKLFESKIPQKATEKEKLVNSKIKQASIPNFSKDETVKSEAESQILENQQDIPEVSMKDRKFSKSPAIVQVKKADKEASFFADNKGSFGATLFTGSKKQEGPLFEPNKKEASFGAPVKDDGKLFGVPKKEVFGTLKQEQKSQQKQKKDSTPPKGNEQKTQGFFNFGKNQEKDALRGVTSDPNKKNEGKKKQETTNFFSKPSTQKGSLFNNLKQPTQTKNKSQGLFPAAPQKESKNQPEKTIKQQQKLPEKSPMNQQKVINQIGGINVGEDDLDDAKIASKQAVKIQQNNNGIMLNNAFNKNNKSPIQGVAPSNMNTPNNSFNKSLTETKNAFTNPGNAAPPNSWVHQNKQNNQSPQNTQGGFGQPNKFLQGQDKKQEKFDPNKFNFPNNLNTKSFSSFNPQNNANQGGWAQNAQNIFNEGQGGMGGQGSMGSMGGQGGMGGMGNQGGMMGGQGGMMGGQGGMMGGQGGMMGGQGGMMGGQGGMMGNQGGMNMINQTTMNQTANANPHLFQIRQTKELD